LTSDEVNRPVGSLLDIAAILIWPVIAVSIWMLIRCSGAATPIKARAGAAILVVIALVFMVVFFSQWSILFLVDYYVLSIFMGALFWTAPHLPPNAGLKNRPLLRRAALVFGIGFVLFGCWNLIGDFLVPRAIVDGRVTNKRSNPSARSIPRYQLAIGGRYFPTVRTIYDEIQPGMLVRGHIGRGSSTLLYAEEILDPK
jgi:hypothetical protein